MEVAISHRNQNSTSPHAVGAASLSPWRLGPHRWSEGTQGGCFPPPDTVVSSPRNSIETNQIDRSRGMQRGGSGGTHLQWTEWNRRQHPSSFPRGRKPRVAHPPIRPEPVEACTEALEGPVLRAHEGGLPRSLSLRSRRTPSATAPLSLQANPNSGAASNRPRQRRSSGGSGGRRSRRGLRRMRAS